ncbi:glycosyltransferase [Acinetobacter ursingii]
MKKVLFFISDLSKSGGTERVTTLIANSLIQYDFQVYLFNLIGSGRSYYILDDKINIYSLNLKPYSTKMNFLKIVKQLREFVKEKNIDNVVVVDSISVVFSSLSLLGLKVNHICWEHFNYKFNLGSRLRTLGRKLATNHCDYIVTLTEVDKIYWENALPKTKARIMAIANPISFQITEKNIKNRNNIAISVGRLTYQKGFDILIKIWKKIIDIRSDLTLKIIGDGEELDKLKLLILDLELSENVEILPATKDILNQYVQSYVYCMTSRFEGLPMVLLEAQAIGLPIVSFDCDTGPKDIILEGQNGFLIDMGDEEKFCKMVVDIFNMNDYEYEILSENSRVNAERFTIDKIIPKWIEILQ